MLGNKFKPACYQFGARVVVVLPAEVSSGRLRRAGQDRLMLDVVVGTTILVKDRQQTRQRGSVQCTSLSGSHRSAVSEALQLGLGA
jgi:hypothetical protein